MSVETPETVDASVEARLAALEDRFKVAPPSTPEITLIAPAAPLLKLDLGAGTTKREGFVRVDVHAFEGIDVVCNLGKDPWPWADASVDEVMASHLFEHLVPDERRHFMNELYRVLKAAPVGKATPHVTLITPHWASMRAYGDPTHVWPPVCEMTYAYYAAEWRKVNAPHLQGYEMDFEVAQPTYTLHPALLTRAVEHQQEKLAWAKEAAQDMIQVLVKRAKP